MSADREFDIVVFGATGFTGRLVADYLAAHTAKNGGGGVPNGAGTKPLRWALAGRDKSKLEAVKRELGFGANPEIVLANAKNDEELLALARRTRVVASTVGPYAKHGLPLVKACAIAGTHYVDITGEVAFMRASIDGYDELAKESGACIVHTCGFDSVPSDLGVALAAETMRTRHGRSLGHVQFVCREAKGGFSGGTIASMFAMFEEMTKDRGLRALIADPYALSPKRSAEPLAVADSLAPVRDAKGAWLAPFLMGSVNTRVVRRTNALLNYAYGRGFSYSEHQAMGRGPAGLAAATAFSAALASFVLAATAAPLRSLLGRVLPAPGEGPSAEARARGSFHIVVHAEADAAETLIGEKPVVQITIRGTSDPGYSETAKMLAEAALTLASKDWAGPCGVTTPAVALGMPYVERLRAAGMTWSID